MVISVLATHATAFASAQTPVDRSGIWRTIHHFERAALRDYEYHVLSREVLQRSQILLSAAQSNGWRYAPADCKRAAQALSFMAAGFHESRLRSEIAHAWFHFARQYRPRRRECLSALGLDANTFPLPWWFRS